MILNYANTRTYLEYKFECTHSGVKSKMRIIVKFLIIGIDDKKTVACRMSEEEGIPNIFNI